MLRGLVPAVLACALCGAAPCWGAPGALDSAGPRPLFAPVSRAWDQALRRFHALHPSARPVPESHWPLLVRAIEAWELRPENFLAVAREVGVEDLRAFRPERDAQDEAEKLLLAPPAKTRAQLQERISRIEELLSYSQYLKPYHRLLERDLGLARQKLQGS